jgi:concanavalin A-like lectin/glucanase superfamily protein
VNKQGGPSQRGWSLNVEPSGVASMQVASNATTLVSVSSGPLPTNQWVHLTGTYAPNAALRIYVDGALAGEKTTGVPPSQYNSTLNVQIGRRPDAQGAWDGKLDEVRVYNRVLTLSEIQAVAQ